MADDQSQPTQEELTGVGEYIDDFVQAIIPWKYEELFKEPEENDER